MSQTTQKLDDDPIVQRFREAFDHVVRADEDSFYEVEAKGPSWVEREDGVVILLHESAVGYGIVDLDDYDDADYLRTDTVGDNKRCYGFSTQTDDVHWVDVTYVRRLANDVFDVSYDNIKSWSRTNSELSPRGVPDDRREAPVWFDEPDSEWSALVCPVVTSDE